MVDEKEQDQNAGRIEGGIDAIVLGACADGLAAAAYLGEAGFRTILLEAGSEIGGEIRQRELAPGISCVDGEHLITVLDPDTIADLDLYRHGISYAARRMDTAYFFEDGQSLEVEGDLMNAAASIDEDIGGGVRFQTFTRDAMEMAAQLRSAFGVSVRKKSRQRVLGKAVDASPDIARRLNQYLLSAGDVMLDDYLPDGMLKTAMLSEVAFRSGAAPHEPFSFMNLIRRWAGEVSGLQAATAYPKNGSVSVVDALRRAVQAAKVEIRAASPVSKILTERDEVAGVQLANGGQIRAPIVVAAMDARRVFLDMIGPGDIDIEFQRAISAQPQNISTAQLHLVLKGFARDDKTKEHMRRRIVYAPESENLRRAFATARAGEIPTDLMIEAIFPNAIENDEGNDERQLLSLMAHPLPFDLAADAPRREAIIAAILESVEKFAPEIEARIEFSDLRLPIDLAESTGAHPAAFSSRSGILQQWALSDATARAGQIDGLYFCGPEAQIGAGISCAAGRLAAKLAIREAKRGAVAA